MRVALPGDKSYSWYENAYDSRAYKRLCAEFAVPPEQDWRQKVDHGCQGLGAWSTFMTTSSTDRHAHVAQGPFFHPKDAMRHYCDISGAWTTFVLDKSEGFTQAGVKSLNDSIRRYVWAIFGAQAQTRSNILKPGTGFDTQKQFLANIEDAITSPIDIPSSIARYQKTLGYASTPLDFVCGIWLYLMPSDMALHPGNVQGYINEIQIAGSDAAIGHNPGINEAEPITHKCDKAFQGKTASPAGTIHKGPQPSQFLRNKTTYDSTSAADPPKDRQSRPGSPGRQAMAHEEDKKALVVVGIAIGIVAIWLSLASQSRAATRNRVLAAMAKAHKFSASQVAVFPNVPRNQQTIEPKIPGRAAAALPAKLPRARPRACTCLLTHSFKPLLSGGLGAGAGTLPPPPVSASTRVEIAMPMAVRIDAMVIPCSRNRVRMRSASVVSSWRSRLNVSRVLMIWDRRVALFVDRASSLACLSSLMSESTLSSFLIRSRITLSVSSVSVSFRCSRARCLSTSDFRSSILVSFARLFANSSLTLVIAFSSPASTLQTWVTHVVSTG